MSTHDRRLAIATVFFFACQKGSTPPPKSDEIVVPPPQTAAAANAPPTTTTFARREAVHLLADGTGFDSTLLNPATGQIQGAHPTKFILEGDAVFMTKNFLSGAKDKRCGTMKRRIGSVDFTGTCGLASSYAKQPDGSFERRERIDLAPGSFTRTLLDPSTGSALGTPPVKFVLEGENIFTMKGSASSEKDKPCGTLKASDSELDVTGTCDLLDFYDRTP